MKYIHIIILFFCAATIKGQDAESLFNQGEARFQQQNYEGAIPFFTKAIEADPGYMNAYLRRGFAYSVLKEYLLADQDFTKIIETHDKHVFAYISRGSARNKLGRFRSALEDFDKALQLDPKNQEAFNNRGWTKEGLGDHKGACMDWKFSKKMGNEEARIILKNTDCR